MTWHLRQLRLRRLDEDQRALLVNTAAAVGGMAAQKLWRMFDKERRQIEGREPKPAGDESEIPRSQADFERMMQEQD